MVNVYKHGDGTSLEELRSAFPEYLDDPLNTTGIGAIDVKYRDYTNLMVSDDQVQTFSDAVVAFWRAMPERIFASQITSVPDWFEKAFIKDRPDLQQANKK